MRRILIVEDEALQRKAIEMALGRQFDGDAVVVEAYADPLVALTRAQAVDVAVVIADYRMPGMNGIAFLREMRTVRPLAMRLMLTASADIDTAVMALNHAEVFRFIRKPWDQTLRKAVVEALARHEELAGAERTRANAPQPARDESPEARAMRELEAMEPGITHVRWGPDGSVLLS